MFTDDKNAQVILSLLKQYGIKKIVISPGTTNVPISRSVQLDPWFEVYSVVDERSAAYFATGLAYESGEPVVISCTGATASRNYLPGLTEAYYRNIPIIALTSQHHTSDFGNLVAQVTDRTISQNDIKKVAVELPVVKDNEDYERCVLAANKALIAATTNGNGPVHINLQVVGDYSFTTNEIPQARKIEYVDTESIEQRAASLSRMLHSKRAAVFIGAHRKFNESEQLALERFATAYKVPVYIDHTSGYNGKNAILISQIVALRQSKNKPGIVIDMGSITGDYTTDWLQGIETWRLSEDGKIHDRFHHQVLLFDGPESMFFTALASQAGKQVVDYHAEISSEVGELSVPIDEMPLSNTYISYLLAKNIPKHSNLHLGILNSLRNMNFFSLDPTVGASSNVGGFGIDGALSTAIGQSMVNKDKLTFCLVGDLAAFYDMNALGIRHIGSNLRIILINNNGGVEFRLNSKLETQWADETDEFISAGGHNGSMRAWAESRGFIYMSASSKEEIEKGISLFTSKNRTQFDAPVLYEVFTKIPDEQYGVIAIQDENKPSHEPEAAEVKEVSTDSPVFKQLIKEKIKKVTPKIAKETYRKIRGRE